jgi:hypothetical protein
MPHPSFELSEHHQLVMLQLNVLTSVDLSPPETTL